MKVFNVLRRFDIKEWGGIESVCLNLSRELNKIECSADILSTFAMSEKVQESMDGIEIRRFNYFYPYLYLDKNKTKLFDRKGGNPISLPLLNYIKKNSSFDLVHIHSFGYLGSTVARECKKLNKPYIVSIHGGFLESVATEDDYFANLYKRTLSFMWPFKFLLSDSKLLENAAGIICVGKGEYLNIKEKFPQKQVSYISNGVNIENFNLPKEEGFLHRKFNIPEGKKTILCLSRIDIQKNQLTLIEVMKRLKEKGNDQYHLLIVGVVTNQSYFKEMNDEVKNSSLEDRITIIPGIKPESEDFYQTFLNSDLFILPSLHEPFGIVVLESWAAKVPVIASNLGGLKHFVEDEVDGLLVDPNSVDDFVNGIEKIEKNGFREKLIENAYQKVCENFSWENCAKKTHDFYKSVLSP